MHKFILATLFFSACASMEADPEATEAAVSSGPTVSLATAPPDTLYSVRAVQFGEGGVLQRVGTPLVSGTVTEDGTSISLPSRPATGDRDPAKPNAPIMYGVFLEDADEDGASVGYSAVPDNFLIFYNGRDRKKPRGWYVIDREGDVSSTDVALRVDTSIRPASEISLPVLVQEELFDSNGLIRFEVDGEPLSGWDISVANELVVKVEGGSPVPLSTDTDTTEARTADVVPVVYEDLDGDGAVTAGQESAVGGLCVQREPMYFRYTAPAVSAQQAWDFYIGRVRTGWQVRAENLEGSDYAPSIQAHTLISARMDCSEAVLPELVMEEAPAPSEE